MKRQLKESKVITNDLVKVFQTSLYRVTTVVPLVKNPKMNVYIFNQKEFDDLLKDYMKFGEFIISVEQVQATA